MTVGGGAFRVPAACCKGGTVEQYSLGLLGLGLEPAHDVTRASAISEKKKKKKPQHVIEKNGRVQKQTTLNQKGDCLSLVKNVSIGVS